MNVSWLSRWRSVARESDGSLVAKVPSRVSGSCDFSLSSGGTGGGTGRSALVLTGSRAVRSVEDPVVTMSSFAATAASRQPTASSAPMNVERERLKGSVGRRGRPAVRVAGVGLVGGRGQPGRSDHLGLELQ